MVIAKPAITLYARPMIAAEWTLVLNDAPRRARPALSALFAFDARLGDVLRTTRTPIAGQMRLAWWREAVVTLDDKPPPPEPVLAALAIDALPLGVSGGELATICDGWERLFADPLDAVAMIDFARERGGQIFRLAAMLLDATSSGVPAAGEGWALADLAGHLREPSLVHEARSLAADRLAPSMCWPRALRPLGALALLARADLAGIAPGSPRRVARLAWHRLTGR